MTKTNQGKATLTALEDLHGAVATALADKIRSGEFTAADLAVARQFLKDNGIDGIPKEGNGLDKLASSLPKFDDDEDE